MRDRNGNPVSEAEARALLCRAKVGAARKPTVTVKNGYAAEPGTGPSGETCKTCRHLVANRLSKTYWKCGLLRAFWTGGAKTDVLLKSPACQHWTAIDRSEGQS